MHSKHSFYHFLLCIVGFLLSASVYAQRDGVYTPKTERVGVVLSGGGAAGLAHIGVLKALDENHIPIDYITGTSAGAMIGCMYSMGYTPAQIEALVRSKEFRNWTYGNLDQKYIFYFKKRENNAGWAAFKLSLDSSFTSNLPTNIISSLPIDFALMEMTAKAASVAHNNFDSLMIPFRCLAADVEAKKTVVFKSGDLGQAVRASMSYPFYLHPVSVDGRILFDGGLYNNFPSDIMYHDFYPDFMIGSNVAGKWVAPDEDNLISQLRAMMMSETHFSSPCENGIIITPGLNNVGLLDFDRLELIDSGYIATMREMPRIKAAVSRRVSSEELEKKRTSFISREKELMFGKITITGVNSNQAFFINKSLRHAFNQVPIEKLKKEYFRLAQDEKIRSLYPFAKYNEVTGFYDLTIRAKKEKYLSAEFGGDFSNRPIDEAFIGLQYNYFGKVGVSVQGNGYYGKLYSSAQAKVRIDVPWKVPVYFEPNITYNRFDFFKSSNAFFEDNKPPYLISNDQYALVDMGIPFGNSGKLLIGTGYGQVKEEYYQSDVFTQRDTADKTYFNHYLTKLSYEFNTLNRKQYANTGTYLRLSLRYNQGEELFEKGSTGVPLSQVPYIDRVHEFVVFKGLYDKYFKMGKHFSLGVYGEAVYSSQSNFNNYTATILSAPVFQPIPLSQTLFMSDFRALKYYAAGAKAVIPTMKNLDLRFEAYIFIPYEALKQTLDGQTVFGKPFDTKHYIGEVALVYHTPLGPICMSVNYFDTPVQNQFSFMLHFGYILFNKRAFD
jgi:NTE family protein